MTLLQFVWKGFTDHHDSYHGLPWQLRIWAPSSCAAYVSDIEGFENQNFFIEKIEPCMRPNGNNGYNIYVLPNKIPMQLTHKNYVIYNNNHS